MKFIQSNTIELKNQHEFILFPYFRETNIKNYLHQLRLDETMINTIVNNVYEFSQNTTHITINNKSIAINFLDLGSGTSFDRNHLIDSFKSFGKSVKEDYQIVLDGLELDNDSLNQAVEAMIRSIYIGAYSFSKMNLSEAGRNHIFSIRNKLTDNKDNLTFTIITSKDIQESIYKASIYGKCINYARMLGDIPNNYLHVEQLTEYIVDLATEYQLACEILGDKELKEVHSGGILAVNAGTKEEAKLITLYYEGCKDEPVTALIGKGVMFDSGGIHLKSISGMEGMKYDMGGAANMIEVFEIAVRLKLKKNILLVIPAVENLTSESSCKMGDVITTMSGKTVEVYNTDAEGRLILCDALTYAIRKGADYLIDLATLTYSCQKALGNSISGVFSNNDEFCQTFSDTAKEQCEKIWRLPLDDIYHSLIKRTQTADLINYAPGSDGGASVAACFLEEFVDDTIPWIHLDVVGTAVNRKDNTLQSIGATGVLISSISAFLEKQ